MTSLKRYAFALGPLTAAVLWGGMYVVSKWGFETIPPVTLGFLRVALGAAALLVVVRLGTAGAGSTAARSSPAVAREDWPAVVALGGLVTLTIATQFLGTDLTNASQGSLLTVLTPVFTVILGAAVLGERVTVRKAGGIALAGVGTAVVLAGQYDLSAVAAGNTVGVALLILASVAWAAFTVFGLPVVRTYSALTAATYATVAAVPMLAVLSLVELAVLGYGAGAIPLDGPTLLAVGYLGLGSTAAAWYLWYTGLEYVSPGTVAVFFFSPNRSSVRRSVPSFSTNDWVRDSSSGVRSWPSASGSSVGSERSATTMRESLSVVFSSVRSASCVVDSEEDIVVESQDLTAADSNP